MSLVCILSCLAVFAAAQVKHMEVNGKIQKGNKPAGAVSIEITSPGIPTQIVISKENGKFDFKLDLQKNYLIRFSKDGLVSKAMEFNTKLPPDQADIIYEYPFNVELFDDLGGVSQNDAMNKPVARISYNPTYENFMDDENYTRQIKSQQDQARRSAEEIHRQQEKLRLDSLNKLWSDSLARAKSNEAKLIADKAEQERLRKEQEKARNDSIDKVNAASLAAAASAAKEKARLDQLALDEAKEKALAETREKASRDSLERASAEKNRRDSLEAVKSAATAKLKLEAEANQREKLRLDSINQAEAALKGRQKFVTDSIALAKQEEDRRLLKEEAMRKSLEKQRLDSLAKAEADINRKNEEAKLREKNKADSISRAVALEKLRLEEINDSTTNAKAAKERQKAIADSKQKALADANAKNALADQARLKRQQDSLAIAKEQELKKTKEEDEARRQQALLNKAKLDSLAIANAEQKQKAEEDRQKKIAEDKARQEALAVQQREQDLKEEADRKAKVLAEIEAKKQMLSKANTVEGNTTPKPKVVAPVPKIIDSDYREGVTDETINESNRIIYRTVVKRDGTAFNYQKIVYNWGGIFYFKNDISITESSFNQDIKNAKDELK